MLKIFVDNYNNVVYSTPHWSTPMTTNQVKQLIQGKVIVDFETGDQDFQHGLRLVLQDVETGEMGLLAVEPSGATLEYSYQAMDAELGPPEHLYDIATRVGPGYERAEVPFLLD